MIANSILQHKKTKEFFPARISDYTNEIIGIGGSFSKEKIENVQKQIEQGNNKNEWWIPSERDRYFYIRRQHF